MARINIEEELFRDKRFSDLSFALGSRDLAMGRLVFAWRLAQERWSKGKNLIPKEEWEKQGFGKEIIECGLAVEFEHGIYMCGSSHQFDWIIKNMEKGQKRTPEKDKQLSNARKSKNTKNQVLSSEPIWTDLDRSELLSLSSNSYSLEHNNTKVVVEKTSNEKKIRTQEPNSSQKQEDLFSKESQRIRNWLKEKKLSGLQSHMILIKDRFRNLEGLEKEYLEFRESYLNSCRTSGKPTSEQAARQYVAGAILKHIGVR